MPGRSCRILRCAAPGLFLLAVRRWGALRGRAGRPGEDAAVQGRAERVAALEQVRRAEREMAELIRAAEEAAAQRVAQARLRAEQIRAEAAERGRRDGDAEAQARLADAEAEAQQIVARARELTARMRPVWEQSAQDMLDDALRYVLAPPPEGGAHEP